MIKNLQFNKLIYLYKKFDGILIDTNKFLSINYNENKEITIEKRSVFRILK